MTDKDKPAAAGDDKGRAKVILPKVQKHQGGYQPRGPGGERVKDGHHAQTHDRKPPRLPGRHGT